MKDKTIPEVSHSHAFVYTYWNIMMMMTTNGTWKSQLTKDETSYSLADCNFYGFHSVSLWSLTFSHIFEIYISTYSSSLSVYDTKFCWSDAIKANEQSRERVCIIICRLSRDNISRKEDEYYTLFNRLNPFKSVLIV